MDNSADIIRQIGPIVERLWPALQRELRGRDPAVQSAVLADLTAMWLAGCVIRDDPNETRRLRAELLGHFTTLVRQLVPVNAVMLGTPRDLI